MIKSELVQKINEENPHLYQRDVERLVETIFNEITSALSNGRRAELRGFGAFSIKHRKPRIGRNPRTGISVEVNEKFVPFFKPGKLLRERLNNAFDWVFIFSISVTFILWSLIMKKPYFLQLFPISVAILIFL